VFASVHPNNERRNVSQRQGITAGDASDRWQQRRRRKEKEIFNFRIEIEREREQKAEKRKREA
jgi:hypothetical protein